MRVVTGCAALIAVFAAGEALADTNSCRLLGYHEGRPVWEGGGGGAVDADFDTLRDLIACQDTTFRLYTLHTDGGEFVDFGQTLDANAGFGLGVMIEVDFLDAADANGWHFFESIGLSFNHFDADSHTNIGSGISTASSTEVNQWVAEIGLGAERPLGAGVFSVNGTFGLNYVDANGTFFANGVLPTASVGAGYWFPVAENAALGVDATYRRSFGSVSGGAGAAVSDYEVDDAWSVALTLDIFFENQVRRGSR